MFHPEADDALELLAETAKSFAGEHLVPALRESESQRGVATTARVAYEQIGLARLELPEALDGAGLGAVARALVNETLAAADPGAALALDPLGPVLPALAELGGDAALRNWALPQLALPGARALLVHESEAPLVWNGDHASGSVAWVASDRVDFLLWLGAEGAALFDSDIALEPLRGSGLRAAGASALRLESAPARMRWRDAAASARALARARLHVASLLLGVLRHAAEFSREYAQERVAFGRPIAHHQALAFLITDMHMAVEGTRLLLHEAAWRADAGHPFEAEAAAVFAEAIEASRFVGPAGVQILGGHGFMQDYPVEKAMRESRALGLMLGGLDAAREVAGRELVRTSLPVALSVVEAGHAP